MKTPYTRVTVPFGTPPRPLNSLCCMVHRSSVPRGDEGLRLQLFVTADSALPPATSSDDSSAGSPLGPHATAATQKAKNRIARMIRLLPQDLTSGRHSDFGE